MEANDSLFQAPEQQKASESTCVYAFGVIAQEVMGRSSCGSNRDHGAEFWSDLISRWWAVS